VERLRFVYGTLGFHGTTLQIAALMYGMCVLQQLQMVKGHLFAVCLYQVWWLICCNVLTPFLLR